MEEEILHSVSSLVAGRSAAQGEGLDHEQVLLEDPIPEAGYPTHDHAAPGFIRLGWFAFS